MEVPKAVYPSNEVKWYLATAWKSNIDGFKQSYTQHMIFFTYIYFPHIKETTDSISRIFKQHTIRIIFNTEKKITLKIPNKKDTIPLKYQRIYEVLGGKCNKSYVRKSNKRINIKQEEHKR